MTTPDHIDLLRMGTASARAHAQQLQTQALALLQSAEVLFRRHSYHLRTTTPLANVTLR